jgi:hypothetical protein
MFRLVITILACVLFLVFGAVGDELLNLLPYKSLTYLPPPHPACCPLLPFEQLLFFQLRLPLLRGHVHRAAADFL